MSLAALRNKAPAPTLCSSSSSNSSGALCKLALRMARQRLRVVILRSRICFSFFLPLQHDGLIFAPDGLELSNTTQRRLTIDQPPPWLSIHFTCFTSMFHAQAQLSLPHIDCHGRVEHVDGIARDTWLYGQTEGCAASVDTQRSTGDER